MSHVDINILMVYSPQADTLNYRPFEVLVEEWKRLRDEGHVTPDVAIWFPIWEGADAYKWAMDNVYSNPVYDDMILRDQNTGKKVCMEVVMGINCEL